MPGTMLNVKDVEVEYLIFACKEHTQFSRTDNCKMARVRHRVKYYLMYSCISK